MSVTLVITTVNRAHLLQHCLNRVKQLTLPDKILVVDDGSADDAKFVCDASGLDIDYIYNDNPGYTMCSLARNIALRNVETDYLITTDPEIVFITDIVAQMKAQHENYPERVLIAGDIYFCKPNYLPHPDMNEERKWEKFDRAYSWLAPYATLYKKDWLMEINGWDESFPGNWGWDDVDVLTRLRINGHGQFIDTDMRALHLYHESLGDMDSNQKNEAHFKSKSYTGPEIDHNLYTEEQRRDIIANRDIEWGKIR